LSWLLRDIALDHTLYYRFEAGNPFAVRYPAMPERLCFHLPLRGRAVFVADGAPPMVVEPGTVLLLRRIVGFSVHDARRSAVVGRTTAAQPPQRQGGTVRVGSPREDVSMLCGEFTHGLPHPLFAGLPSILTIDEAGSGIGSLVRIVDAELTQPRSGGEVVLHRLSEVIFIQILRLWLHRRGGDALAVYRDPRLGRALRAIHDDPAQAWSVAVLARLAGMSRTTFAQRFTARVGETPIAYVRARRLAAAVELLRSGTVELGELGERVGYRSQAAFSRAFAEHFGVAPGAFRQRLASARDLS